MLIRARPYLDAERLVQLLASGAWDDASPIGAFEREFCNRIQSVRAFAIHQGRSALMLGLKALGLSRGDEIVVQSLICSTVLDAILATGVTPVLVGNSLEDYQVNTGAVRNSITKRTKAILVAHLYGIPCEIGEFVQIAKKTGCYLIEDCAHCLGAQYDGRPIGSFGHIAFHSFNFDKPLSIGQGGMLAINDDRVLEKAKSVLSRHARVSTTTERQIILRLLVRYLLTARDAYAQLSDVMTSTRVGSPRLLAVVDDMVKEGARVHDITRVATEQLLSYRKQPSWYERAARSDTMRAIKRAATRWIPAATRGDGSIDQPNLLMNSLRCAVGLQQSEGLDRAVSQRNARAEYLSTKLDTEKYQVPRIGDKRTPSYLRYTILAKTIGARRSVEHRAFREGYEISNFNWPRPAHDFALYRRAARLHTGSLADTDQIVSRMLNIPIHTHVTSEDLDAMLEILDGED